MNPKISWKQNNLIPWAMTNNGLDFVFKYQAQKLFFEKNVFLRICFKKKAQKKHLSNFFDIPVRKKILPVTLHIKISQLTR